MCFGLFAFGGFMFFTLCAFNSFYTLFGPDDTAYVMVGVFFMMLAGYFFRLATDFQDWEQRPEYQDQIDALSEDVQELSNRFNEL